MHRVQPSRLIGVAALVASSLTLTGGALFATTTPASAAPGGIVTCQSLSLFWADTDSYANGTIGGCSSKGHAAGTVVIPDLDLPFGTTNPGTIAWTSGKGAKGMATSVISVTPVFDGGTECVPLSGEGEVAYSLTLYITVTGGPYAGTSGTDETCFDTTITGMGASNGTIANAGPVTL